MEVTAEWATLSGILISIVSVAAGKFWGGYGKMTVDQCNERRGACSNLSKVTCDSIERRLSDLEAAVFDRKK